MKCHGIDLKPQPAAVTNPITELGRPVGDCGRCACDLGSWGLGEGNVTAKDLCSISEESYI